MKRRAFLKLLMAPFVALCTPIVATRHRSLDDVFDSTPLYMGGEGRIMKLYRGRITVIGLNDPTSWHISRMPDPFNWSS